MFLFDFFARKPAPLCFSVEMQAAAPRQVARKRHGVGRRALSLAAIHNPPDKPAAENGPMATWEKAKAHTQMSAPLSCQAYRRRKRKDRRR